MSTTPAPPPLAEDKLVVLLSQPRSGTTLLQHLLGSHSRIHTVPEPWLLLPIADVLRDDGSVGPYNRHYAHLALDEFCERSGARAALVEGLRATVLGAYGAALTDADGDFFLDKTTRYFHVIAELAELLPRARYVILTRHPLAVLSSICRTNFNGDWRAMFAEEDRRADVLEGPRALARELHAPTLTHRFVVRYEELVADPAAVLEPLCAWLAIDFEQDMIEYRPRVRFENTTWVDPKSIYRYDRPVTHFVDAWKEVADGQELAILRGYFEHLGREVVERLGYDFDQTLRDLDLLRPKRRSLFRRQWDEYLGLRAPGTAS